MYKKLISMLLLAVPMLSFAQELTIDEQIEEKFKPFADAVSAVVFYPI
jgi:AGCS family alanine or glycine:cation symporter